MAAYAALVSLMNTMEQIQNHPRHSLSLDKKQIEFLQEKVVFLQDFIECNSHGGSKEAEVLESQITSVAYDAEDAIESHVVDQILARSTSLIDLQKVIQNMNSIKEKVMEVKEKEKRRFRDHQPTYSVSATSSRPLTAAKNTMVGFDDELIQLLDKLTGEQSNQLIIPIVGMGGIGKTTLAKNVYENLVIVQHFDIRAWAAVSQQINVRGIFLQLLSCLKKQENNEMDEKTEDQLGKELYQSLYGRRYLIILDDMWNIDAWNKIKFFFPENYNRSRIIVTTRLSNLAIHFGSSGRALNLLDEEKSWKLFCQNVFAQESCPPELEEIGKKIVGKCKGLPLSIVVIGVLLRKSSRTQVYWEDVANDINSILNSGEDEQCLNILSLSYNNLPVHLKPCFLYMGIFPEDHEIRVSKLIKLWIAEGFLKLKKAESLEEVAKDYLKDLVDRNLIFVRRLGSRGKIRTCNIHDILRNLCLRVAEKEQFLCVLMHDIRRCIDRKNRIVFHESIPERRRREVFDALKPLSFARSLICYGGRFSFRCRMLRVLDGADLHFLKEIFQQVNLRYLACRALNFKLPTSISLLWNVQTLIIRVRHNRIAAPYEIWYMPQLRHLQIYPCCLLDAPPSDQQDDFVLGNLQTLMKIRNFKLSEEVCKRIPNVKKLYLIYQNFSRNSEAKPYEDYLHNLGCLQKLESLTCKFYATLNRDELLQNLTFPSSLKKLSLKWCFLQWEDLTIIGSLPNLEALKLERGSVTGPEWNPVEGEFLCLKFLKIDGCEELIHWNADSFHFPVLENLLLGGLWDLNEIPSGIGEISTLRVIHLVDCSESAANSALKILEEQESFGNDDLQVRVLMAYRKELESFREKMELQSNNFQLRMCSGSRPDQNWSFT